mgnify:CR=1 FL=1
MKVKIINKAANDLPFYATKGSAGMDVYSNEEIVLSSLSTTIIKTGLFVKIPEGYEIQVRPRSGLSAKSSLRIANSPGTIDSDYLGEIGIIVDNTSQTFSYTVKKGERIAQLVLKKVEQIEWEEVEEFSETTERNTGGFGSTGK